MSAPVSATQAQAILQLLAEAANQHLQSQSQSHSSPPVPPSHTADTTQSRVNDDDANEIYKALRSLGQGRRTTPSQPSPTVEQALQFAPPPPAPSRATTTMTTTKSNTRHSTSSRSTNPSPLSSSYTPAPPLDLHPPTDEYDPNEEDEGDTEGGGGEGGGDGVDPATLLFNDYFDFPSSDEEDDPDFLPRLTPADSTAASGQHGVTPQTLGVQEDEEEDGGRDWWADVFGRGADESEDEDEEDEEGEEVVGLTREEFEKELALLTGEVEGFNHQNQNQSQRSQDRTGSSITPVASTSTAGSSAPSTKASKKRSSSKKTKASQSNPSDDAETPRTSPRRKRTSSTTSDTSSQQDDESRPTKKSKSSSKKSKKSRLASPPALSPIPESVPSFAPPPPHSRPRSTVSPDPPPPPHLTLTGEPRKLRPRAIYTEEEAKERRKAQERERQARKRAKAIEDKEAMGQKIEMLEFALEEWKVRAKTAEKRVRELLEERRERREQEQEQEEEEEESDGGEFVMGKEGEGESTEESSEEEEEDVEDQVMRLGGEEGGLEIEKGQPQMDLNLSNLGQGDLNQLLALVQNAAMAQGIQLEGGSTGERGGGGT